MGASLSFCQKRKREGEEQLLADLDEYQWDGMDEERIEAYESAKDKAFDEHQESLSLDEDDPTWVSKLPQEPKDVLKMLLVRRAMHLVHVLRPIEETRKGTSMLHSQGVMSTGQWESYQHAEELCSTELKLITEETKQLQPGVAPNSVIQMAVKLYKGPESLKWPQGQGPQEARETDEPPAPFKKGQKVKWVGADEDIEKGEVGEVVGGLGGDRIRVKFKKGTWAFTPYELVDEARKPIVPRPEVGNGDGQAPPLPFKLGMKVRWMSSDDDVPEGEVGEIVGGLPNGSIRIKFEKGTWAFPGHELRSEDGEQIVPMEDEFQIHPDATEQPHMQLQVVLKRPKGGKLGIVLNHDPPLEKRPEGYSGPSTLLIGKVMEGGYVSKHNAEHQTEPMEILLPGDRIVAALDTTLPEDQRKPTEGSKEVFEIITKDEGAVTPLVFFVVRMMGPPLRFKPGQRVQANCASEGWLHGIVVKVWDTDQTGKPKPYAVRIEESGEVVLAPRDDDDCVKKGKPRFEKGQQVAVNVGPEGGYRKATIAAIKEDDKTKTGFVAKMMDGSGEVEVPEDMNQFIRPLARFKAGDKVMARVSGGYQVGVVKEVYHPRWAYAIKLNDSDNLVTAPEDLDLFVKKFTGGGGRKSKEEQ